MGMVIGHRAMEMAIRKAKESGIGMVGVRNSRHYGMSAYYAMLALPHDMIGIAMTNASRQVVPTFGREARFGTNPMCFAVPADKELPFVWTWRRPPPRRENWSWQRGKEKRFLRVGRLTSRRKRLSIRAWRKRRGGFFPLGGSRKRQS